MNLEQFAYNLPSTQAFVSAAACPVGASLVLLPDSVSRQMVGRMIRNWLRDMDVSLREVYDPPDGNPVIVSAELLGASWPTSRTRRNVANLLQCDGLPDVFYVHRIPPVDSLANREWTQFLVEWAHESQALRESGASKVPSLCVIAKLKDLSCELLHTESSLSVHWWLGFPSALEMRLACRTANLDTDSDEESRRWREQVLPGLVGSDVQLAEHLWDAVTEGTDSVVNNLISYWNDPDRIEFGGEVSDVVDLVKKHRSEFTPGQAPPHELQHIWDCGGLIYTPEYGLEAHPALLAHDGRRPDVEHMLWRGQAELLLPILNEVRLRVCEHMTAHYGDGWPTRWWSPATDYEREAVSNNPLATELGHVDYLLRYVGKSSDRHPLDIKRHLAPLVSMAKDIRNEIAHYNPVSLEEFTKLSEARNRVGI